MRFALVSSSSPHNCAPHSSSAPVRLAWLACLERRHRSSSAKPAAASRRPLDLGRTSKRVRNESQGRLGKNVDRAPPSRRPVADAEEEEDAQDDSDIDLDALLNHKELLHQLRNNLISGLAAQHQRATADEPLDDDYTASTVQNTRQQPKTSNGRTPKAAAQHGGVAETKPPAAEPKAGAKQQLPTVILKPGKDWLFKNGSPMVYSGAIGRSIGGPAPQMGDPVLVADANGEVIAWGVFNPVSMFRIRVMQLRQEYDHDNSCFMDMPKLIRLRVRQAVQLRSHLGLPNNSTNVYRLINSEGDHLSGLIADVLGSHVVVQSVAGWAERYQSKVMDAIKEATGLTDIIWRRNADILREEGIQVPAALQQQQQQQQQQPDAMPGTGEVDTDNSNNGLRVVVSEAGVKFYAAPFGQKTGFYADQRESRTFLAPLCTGKSVLDLCTYSGGFALAAAVAGATDVTGVDSSGPAVELAKANARLNGLKLVSYDELLAAKDENNEASTSGQAGASSSGGGSSSSSSNAATVTFIQDDIEDFMQQCAQAGAQYDIVVLDPPKLAPNRGSLPRAKQKYIRVNKAAMALVRPNGLLMTCSCSGAMTQSGEFVSGVLMEAAQQAGRQIKVLREAGAAADHPLNPAYPEGRYLTNITVVIA